MRNALNRIKIDMRDPLSEKRRNQDEAPMLYIGEALKYNPENC